MVSVHTDRPTKVRRKKRVYMHQTPSWLDEAVFYEIYPQSFYDSNGDGIGDIPGITAKLDYISSLGCNALWINPCFDSPFKDAGYDVRDYTKVAPRYGTNQDLVDLFGQAHRRGIHVLLDLVPGHTSEEHAWFASSGRASRNEYSDRYIWTDSSFEGYPGMPFIGGEAPRDAAYILNFFKCQPALNYGFASRDRSWQQSPDDPGPTATRQAMIDVMRFWLSQGCDGFRVDMADSLVKNDDKEKTATIDTWHRLFEPIRKEFPQAAFVSEWGKPWQSLEAGFDMDFYLNWRWAGVPNGYNFLTRNTEDELEGPDDASYFKADSKTGISDFLADYLPQYLRSRNHGSFCFITCNHDTTRLAPRLTPEEIKVAYGMFLTMPGVPFIYYGDEIGMRYQALPTKEGGYHRTGSRTPMQWDGSANRGFSKADPTELYLPVDGSPDAPNVADQDGDPESLLTFIRQMTTLRSGHQSLRPGADFAVVHAPRHGRSFAYTRTQGDDRLLVALNPSRQEEDLPLSLASAGATDHIPRPLVMVNSDLSQGTLALRGQSFAVLAL